MEDTGNPASPPPLIDVAVDDVAHWTPDWKAINEELNCPLCGYNLRGLINPRCPECGYQFQWRDLLDPSRRGHPYLFEFYPKQNFRSFWKTVFHGLRPTKFWKSVRADHPIVPGRLRLYWMIVAAIFILGFASNVGVLVWDYNVQRWGTPMPVVSTYFPPGYKPAPPPVIANFSFVWPWRLTVLPFGIIAAIILLWPWLTYISLALLRASMRQAKVKSAHVFRCVVYSWDIVLWAALLTFALNFIRAVLEILNQPNSRKVAYYTTPYWGLAIPINFWTFLLPIFAYRMIVAYEHYLRFRHIIATIVLSQIMVALAVLTALTYFFLSDYSDWQTRRMIFGF